jgi:tetratricopeptide (TPR) repeat protein
METASAKIIHHPSSVQDRAPSTRERSYAETDPGTDGIAQELCPEPLSPPVAESSYPDFFSTLAEQGVKEERACAERKRVLGEISVLRAENSWEDILALFHPVEEKVPELAALGLAAPVRAEAAFALGHLGRHDEAIDLYTRCLADEPENFHYHSGLAYAAYDTLYASKGRQLMLHPAERKVRIELAHRHFAMAQSLRPERVTNYYLIQNYSLVFLDGTENDGGISSPVP